MQGVAGTPISDEGYQDDIDNYIRNGYELLLDGMENAGNYEAGKTKTIRVSLIHTYTTVDKNSYEADKCLNEACSVKQPVKKPGC